jgi:hypothetical protein
MQTETLNAERRRRNIRAAWLLAAFALFIAVSSVPFWRGLYQLAMGAGQ